VTDGNHESREREKIPRSEAVDLMLWKVPKER